MLPKREGCKHEALPEVLHRYNLVSNRKIRTAALLGHRIPQEANDYLGDSLCAD